MAFQTQIELYEDILNRKDYHVCFGRRHFLVQNNIIPEPRQVIHSISYSGLNPENTVIEVYLDELCKAAAFHYPDCYPEVVTAMLSESLLAQIILSELQLSYDVQAHPFSSFLAANIADDIVASILGRSFSKKIREQAFDRVLAHYSSHGVFV